MIRTLSAATLAIAFALPAAGADDRFAAISLPALDACVGKLAEGEEQAARDCLAPMMAICVRARTEGQPVEDLRACIEAETRAWQPVIDAHFEEIAAQDDARELTRNEMMRRLANDIVDSRCPQMSQDGVSDAYCELRTTGSLAIDLRLDRARGLAETR